MAANEVRRRTEREMQIDQFVDVGSNIHAVNCSRFAGEDIVVVGQQMVLSVIVL